MNNWPAYGHWQLVIINSLIILGFAFGFFRPRTRRDWRTFGAFAAFIVALFTEMYGFPLTIYLLSGWLTSESPGVNWYSHDSGHLLITLLGWRGDAHIAPLHILSNLLILGGLILLGAAWRVLYNAQRTGSLAAGGPYAVIRHPLYAAFTVIMVGFLIQWPTLPILIMFPILIRTYVRLANAKKKRPCRRWAKPMRVTPGRRRSSFRGCANRRLTSTQALCAKEETMNFNILPTRHAKPAI